MLLLLSGFYPKEAHRENRSYLSTKTCTFPTVSMIANEAILKLSSSHWKIIRLPQDLNISQRY